MKINPRAVERLYHDVTFGFDEPSLAVVGTPYGMVTLTPGKIDGPQLAIAYAEGMFAGAPPRRFADAANFAKGAAIKLRLSDEELVAWKHSAVYNKRTLSAWIRYTCNGAVKALAEYRAQR